ncbi:MAG: nucleotidyltransferase family protein [Spirochaetales bacterium]|jgi:predicted nucleotidyltransferase|nr:nucleotidyltransferase family protein [Exilispira sp.]NMC66991.1 nucleotidyltransferase family protein [Spirochaetales bacterium]
MITKQYVIKKLKEYKEVLKENFSIKQIGIFGSYAKDNFNDESDIDIYVEFDLDKISLDKYFALIEFLEKKFKRKVDIITKGGIQTIRIPEVKREIEESIKVL